MMDCLDYMGFHDAAGPDREDWGFDAWFSHDGYKALAVVEKLGIDYRDDDVVWEKMQVVPRAT